MMANESGDGPKGREPTLKPTVHLCAKVDGKKQAFKVYDMPDEVLSRFIAYTKGHAGNKAWVAIDTLLSYANLGKRLDSMEERLARLEGNQNGKI